MKWLEDLANKFTVSQSDISQLWKVIDAYDGTVVSYDPFMVTGIAYFPISHMKAVESWVEDMKDLFKAFTSVPEDTVMNAYLLKFFEEPNVEAKQVSKYNLMNFLESKRIDQLNRLSVPTYLPFLAITMPVQVKYQNKRGIIKDYFEKKQILKKINKSQNSKDNLNALLADPNRAKAFRDTIKTLEDLFEQIRVRFGGNGVQRLDNDQLWTFLSCLLNHTEHRPVMGIGSVFESDIIADAKTGVMEYGNNLHATISARTKDLPKEIDGHFPWLFYEDSLQRVPFNVQCTIRFPAIDKAREDAQRVINNIDFAGNVVGQVKRMLKHDRDQMQMAMDALIEANGRIVDVGYTITTWAKTDDELETNFSSLRNVLQGRGMGMSRDTFNLKAAYHSQVPWQSYHNKIMTRLTSMNAEVMMPPLYPPVYPRDIRGYTGIAEPVYFHTHYDQLTCVDMFDKRCSVWNGVIVGQSGTGKSFLGNYILFNDAQYNHKIFCIDKGGEGAGSYRNLFKNLKGTYVELNFKSSQKFSVNPFDGALFYDFIDQGMDQDGGRIEIAVPSLDGKPTADKVTLLIGIITMMICENEDARLAKDQEEFLQVLLEEAYRDYNNNEGNLLTISIFANEYLLPHTKDVAEAIRNIRLRDSQEWALDFFNKMSKYINSGIYADFFGKTSDLDASDLVCFDLEGLDEQPDLKGILTAIIINFCYKQAMDGNPGKKKIIFIDEAWALLRGGPLAAMVENIWRTIRKHGGRIYCATQDFESIMASPAGRAILGNSTYFFMLGSNYEWETLAKIKATGQAGVNRLTHWDFNNIVKQQFVKGKYSEFFLLNPVFKGVLRFRASPYDYEMATTDPGDKEKQNALKRKYGVDHVTPEIIMEIIGNR